MTTPGPTKASSFHLLLSLLTAFHGVIFGWFAATLPTGSNTLFSGVTYTLGALYLVTAGLALFRTTVLSQVWRVVSWLTLVYVTWMVWQMVTSATYIAAIYGALGVGVGALLAVLGVVLLGLTLPISIWGLRATWPQSGGLLALVLGQQMAVLDTTSVPATDYAPQGPRLGVSLLAALYAAIGLGLGWWLPYSVFSVVTLGLGGLSLVTLGCALAQSKFLNTVWRAYAWLTVMYLGWIVLEVALSAVYLAGVYGQVGSHVPSVLGTFCFALLVLTLPFPLWGLWRTRPASPWKYHKQISALLVVGVCSALVWVHSLGGATTTAGHNVELSGLQAPSGWAKATEGSVFTAQPAVCKHALDSEHATAFVAFRSSTAPKQPQMVCVQAAPHALVAAINTELQQSKALPPVKIDVVTGQSVIAPMRQAVAVLGVRPGLDGACSQKQCLAPWQLTALNQFLIYMPIPFIPDLRYGFSPTVLRKALGEKDNPSALASGLTRVVTQSVVLRSNGQLTSLQRDRLPSVPVTAESVAQAKAAAVQYVVRSQQPNGFFHYGVDPYTGAHNPAGWNLHRQAGTTLAMCESSEPTQANTEVIRKALGFIARRERRVANLSAITAQQKPKVAALGETALPTIAFAQCRTRVGTENDVLLNRLAQYLLAMQRKNGGFYPYYSMVQKTAGAGPDPLYAPGQAVFALVLLEQIASGPNPPKLPPKAVLHDAVARAMTYYGTQYWDTPAKDFFYLEENWHCLAARAALTSHPHSAYEQFCLDYAAFRNRLVLTAESNVSPDFVGGFGFGNVLPPQNTPTAGQGETLAAAMAIKVARGEDIALDQAVMRDIYALLLKRQWSDAVCFACANPAKITGGFSMVMGMPRIQIDYVQHALSAFDHGAPLMTY